MKCEQPDSKLRLKGEYRYKGMVYRPEVLEDLKKDTYEVVHWVEDLHLDVQMMKVDFTPYHRMSKVDFETWVDLGCPKAPAERLWTQNRLRDMMKHNIRPESFTNKVSNKIKEGIKSDARETRNT